MGQHSSSLWLRQWQEHVLTDPEPDALWLPVVIRGIHYRSVGRAPILPRNWPWGVIGIKVTLQGQWTQQIFTQQTSRSVQWVSNSLPSILSYSILPHPKFTTEFIFIMTPGFLCHLIGMISSTPTLYYDGNISPSNFSHFEFIPVSSTYNRPVGLFHFHTFIQPRSHCHQRHDHHVQKCSLAPCNLFLLPLTGSWARATGK